MDIQLKRGMLDVCVLSVLNGGESYGYKIITDLAQYVTVSESTLYPILKRLEQGNFVTTRTAEYNGRLRKYYMITKAGLDQLKGLDAAWHELARGIETIRKGLKTELDEND